MARLRPAGAGGAVGAEGASWRETVRRPDGQPGSRPNTPRLMPKAAMAHDAAKARPANQPRRPAPDTGRHAGGRQPQGEGRQQAGQDRERSRARGTRRAATPGPVGLPQRLGEGRARPRSRYSATPPDPPTIEIVRNPDDSLNDDLGRRRVLQEATFCTDWPCSPPSPTGQPVLPGCSHPDRRPEGERRDSCLGLPTLRIRRPGIAARGRRRRPGGSRVGRRGLTSDRIAWRLLPTSGARSGRDRGEGRTKKCRGPIVAGGRGWSKGYDRSVTYTYRPLPIFT
jgi:hypothetical protein